MSAIPAVAQGIQSILTATIVDGAGVAVDYSATSPALVAEVWPGSTLAVTFSPSASWNNAALGLVDVLFTIGNTATVAPGQFSLRIRAADSSVWMYEGFVEIVASPSNTVVLLPDLCTIPYAHAALSSQSFTEDEWQFLPYAIKSASAMIRRWCCRIFNRQEHIETLIPELDGAIRLKEIPVNIVTRLAGVPASALTVTCSNTSNQQARIYFSTTGNRDEPGGIVSTGLTLVRTSSGTTTTSTLLWTDYPLITNLATAINALGNGWSAQINNNLGQWATSELIGGETGQGCLSGTGGVLQVYSEDLNLIGTDFLTGFVWVGITTTDDVYGPRWGYNWQGGDSLTARNSLAPVRVTYNAGFDTIPEPIQSACANVAKQLMFRYRMNPLFKGETAHQYSYEMREVLHSIGTDDQQALSLYRITNA